MIKDQPKYLGLRVPKETWKALKEVALSEEKDLKDLFLEGLEEVLKRRGRSLSRESEK